MSINYSALSSHGKRHVWWNSRGCGLGVRVRGCGLVGSSLWPVCGMQGLRMAHVFSHSIHKCTDTELLSEAILSDSEACPFRCIIQCTAGDSALMDVQDYLPSSFWSIPSLAALLHWGWHPSSLFFAAVTNVVPSIGQILTATVYYEGDVTLL